MKESNLPCVVSLLLPIGIERESDEDKSFGDFTVEGKDSPYRTLNFTYEPHEFDKLVELSCYNVLNNKDIILEALNLALSRRKLKKAKTRAEH